LGSRRCPAQGRIAVDDQRRDGDVAGELEEVAHNLDAKGGAGGREVMDDVEPFNVLRRGSRHELACEAGHVRAVDVDRVLNEVAIGENHDRTGADDHEPTLCEHPEPSLTSVDVGYDRIGYEAAKLMDDLLTGGKPPRQPRLIPPREWVVRHSSDFLYVDDPLVTAAMQFIANHSRDPVSVEDIAGAAGASRRALELRFRARLNRSVAAEMRRVRIEHAKRLLIGSDLAIAAIAKRAGYSSNPQMTRVFQRELGVTPRTYRQKFDKRE
jgi:AraC-like DNA-binding protein